MKNVLAKTGAIALTGVMLMTGAVGCKRRDAFNSQPSESSVNGAAESADIRAWCEKTGTTYMNSVIQMDFTGISSVVDYTKNSTAELQFYEYSDSVMQNGWSYDFYSSILHEATYVTTGFNYDPETAVAHLDYRISVPDYSATSADGAIKYTLGVDFNYDATAQTAFVSDPATAINNFYKVAERDYVNYILEKADLAFLTPTPTPAGGRAPTPVPTDDPGVQPTDEAGNPVETSATSGSNSGSSGNTNGTIPEGESFGDGETDVN